MFDRGGLDDYIKDNNIRFIRLSFFDIFGEQRNIAIMPGELDRALTDGIPFDSAAIPGFLVGDESDLFLEPDFDTMSMIPWRSFDGGVLRVLCDVAYPDGRPFERDPRYILKQAVKRAEEMNVSVQFGSEIQFYIFKTDENGNATKEPHDDAGYFAVSPADKGENARRGICYTLNEMGIIPRASHHEKGPGQHEVVFGHGDPLQAADNTTSFKWIVENSVMLDGCRADFSPKPLRDKPGNGMYLMIAAQKDGEDVMEPFMAGVMAHIREMTLFLNPSVSSYERLGTMEAPGYITWSRNKRSNLIRIPAIRSGKKRFELRSPDPCANPYLAYALIIYAGLDGVIKKMVPERSIDADSAPVTPGRLPIHKDEAIKCACESRFISEYIPREILDGYCEKR